MSAAAVSCERLIAPVRCRLQEHKSLDGLYAVGLGLLLTALQVLGS
jgi:hypothetical protein